MSRRGRAPFNPRAGFQKPTADPQTGVSQALLKQGRKSGQLNLSNRNLTTVPDTVWRINLDVPEEGRTVSLDEGGDRWWEQTDLVKLILASNKLQEISEDIRELPALSVLDVHDNQLVSLPQAIGELQNLTKLNLSHNKLTQLPDDLFLLRNLHFLHLEHNEMTELNENIGELTHLEDLNVSNNKLTSLPTSLGNLRGVKTINVSNNQIAELPYTIGLLKSVRMLDATHNSLKEVPEELGDMASLEQLYLRHNQITKLPVMRSCSTLKELHAGNNRITQLSPDHLKNLGLMSVLDLRDNKISELHEDIVLLKNLQRLDLTNNDLSNLPYKLGTLTTLKSLVLEGNPLRSIRRDILSIVAYTILESMVCVQFNDGGLAILIFKAWKRGTMGLMKYLRSRIEEEPASQDAADSGGAPSSSVADIGRTAAVAGKTFDYSNKKATDVPATLWEPAKESEVTAVNFSKNVFTKVPANIILLSSSVMDVNLGFNKLTSLPVEMQMMTRLTHLDLRNNALSTIPSEFSTMENMREITISLNRFTELPQVIFTWGKLENILASDNQIGAIDIAGLKRLPMIATLDLQNNNIAQVPPELGTIETLRSLQLSGNAFRNPRPAILAKGTPSLLAYLKDRIPAS